MSRISENNVKSKNFNFFYSEILNYGLRAKLADISEG